MPSTLTPPLAGGRVDPVRARGLRRSRSGAPCAPLEQVPMPARLDPVMWLALQTRARTPRVIAGLRTPRAEWTPGYEVTPKGLYSKRLFESRLSRSS